jgi:hypothetical protein
MYKIYKLYEKNVYTSSMDSPLIYRSIILQFEAGRTMIKNVILFYFILSMILNKNGFMCRIQIKEGVK